MACHVTTAEKQSEYEFFSQLTEFPQQNDCCGPLVPLGFVQPALGGFHRALTQLAVPDSYLDNFETQVLDSGIFVVVMCSKHWIKHSQAFATLGHKEDVAEWKELAYYIYRFVSTLNNWDYKEITNYLKTLETLQQKE